MKKLRVLVIDDSQEEVRALSVLLEKAGYEVLAAYDGDEGISLARQEIPDLILMDIVMPQMNGFQATRQLMGDELTCNIPVIVLSAKDEEIDRVWALRQGARAYVSKSRQRKTLFNTIDQVMTG